MNDGETEAFLERLEISVSVKERVLSPQAERRNQTIDGLANGVTMASKRPIVARRLARQHYATHIEDLTLRQRGLDLFRDHVVTNPLQHLAKDDVCQSETLTIEFSIQPVGLGIGRALQVVDPDGGVDNHHVYFASRA